MAAIGLPGMQGPRGTDLSPSYGSPASTPCQRPVMGQEQWQKTPGSSQSRHRHSITPTTAPPALASGSQNLGGRWNTKSKSLRYWYKLDRPDDSDLGIVIFSKYLKLGPWPKSYLKGIFLSGTDKARAHYWLLMSSRLLTYDLD